MNATVEIQPHKITRDGFALVNILKSDSTRLCQIDMDYSKLASLGQANETAMDLLLLAASVYALDKLVLRNNAPDCWHRKFVLRLPVSDARKWNSVKNDLDRCISFLTGDSWDINFIPQETSLDHLNHPVMLPQTSDAVSLFSGGLDSLIGAIDWLELNKDNGLRLCVVGHYDGEIVGTNSDQKKLLRQLKSEYPDRITDIFVRIGHNNESTKNREPSLRGRSFLFVALGIFVASAFGPNTPLFIPENGTIALNIPLTPSRRGSCSTRTAHPHYLDILSHVLAELGFTNPFSNPLGQKTKGESVLQCLNRELLRETARISVSCAKRGRKQHFTHREATSCGRCMPCIYRRAALHTIGLDNERYGDDICIGEVNYSNKGEKANDLRACLTFLRQDPTIAEISTMLIASGSLDVCQLPDYAAMVQRTMNEIRTLLRDKATPEIKRLAGV